MMIVEFESISADFLFFMIGQQVPRKPLNTF